MPDYELLIIGAGPAGLTAGLYAARSRLKAAILEKLSPGGQVLSTAWVDNYPGFPEGLSGFELIDRMRAQVERFGLPIISGEVKSLVPGQGEHAALLADGRTLTCRALILATGANPRRLGAAGEVELTGKGVSYCGTCDAPFYRDQVVAAVGGGDTAVEEALYLTRFAKKIHLVHRRDKLRAQKILQEKLLANDKVVVHWDSAIDRVEGQNGVSGVVLRNLKTGAVESLAVDGCFVFVGVQPTTQFCCDFVELDRQGFIVTDPEMATARPGVFAAGDCRAKLLRQISTAVGDGATAAFNAERYIEGLTHA